MEEWFVHCTRRRRKESFMDKILLWVGDYCSKKSPTNLPDGSELVDYMIEEIWGESALQTFKNRITSYNAFIHKINGSFGNFLYSDYLISQWGRIKTVNIHAGVSSFLKAPYNEGHCYLAMLLSKGATIITTNMDLCIEDAYNDFMEGTDRMALSEYEGGVAIYSGNRKESGCIYHIHGSAQNTFSLGGRIEIGTHYFSKTFRGKMKEWMSENYELYGLGYDFRDIYDVNIFIGYLERQLKEVNWKANIVTTKFRKEQPYPLRGMLTYFEHSNFIRKNTIKFCKDLYMEKTNRSLEEVEESVLSMLHNQKKSKINWKVEVKKGLKNIGPYRDIMLLYVNQSLGVLVEDLEPDIFERLQQMPEAYRTMYMSLMFRYRHDLIPMYGYQLEETQLLEQKEEEKIFGEELLRLSQDEYNKINPIILELCDQMNKIQVEYFNALRRKTVTISLERKAKELLDEVNQILPEEKNGRILKIPKNNYRDFSDLYRLRGVLWTICSQTIEEIKEIELNLQASLMYSSQSGNRQGVLKTLQYSSFCYFCFYYKYGKKSFYDKGQRLKSLEKKQQDKDYLG